MINKLRPITCNELLTRQEVEPQINLITNGIKNKNICVTGAGGSIGSELCRQLIEFQPSKIFLLERNELKLYEIDRELSTNNPNSYKNVFPILGDVRDAKFLKLFFLKIKFILSFMLPL